MDKPIDRYLPENMKDAEKELGIDKHLTGGKFEMEAGEGGHAEAEGAGIRLEQSDYEKKHSATPSAPTTPGTLPKDAPEGAIAEMGM